MSNGNDYGQQAIERFDHPRNRGRLRDATGHARITGPCGDTMEVWIKSADGSVAQATFDTDGCGPSIASGSMATELAIGRSLTEAARIRQQDILEALGGLTEESKHCALLAANTLKAAVTDCLERRKAQTPKEEHRDTTCGECEKEDCSAKTAQPDESEEQLQERQALARRLCQIEHKILVLSGKGGVGKSTVAVNLAVSLSLAGKRVGLLDVDIHGPSIPRMLGLEGQRLEVEDQTLLPMEIGDLKVVSIGLLLSGRNDAVIWRGPLKMGIIKQFLKDVEWGELDYLIIDSPPGTGDEPLSVCQLIPGADGAVIVTTPQEVALSDVRRCVTFCRQLRMPVLGVVENMSGFACPKCGEVTDIFKSGGGERMSKEMGVPFLGRIPIDPKIAQACDDGKPYVHHYAKTPTAKAFQQVIGPILGLPYGVPHERDLRS
jgi:ATP-binding protein involved in chromosome partitioning